MKKYICSIILLLALPMLSIACDICGCGVGNNYIGILPEFRRQVFGLRYRYNSLLTHVGVGGTTTYLTTKENYQTLEAWGGWNITKNIRVMASIPYSFNERINQGSSRSKNGLGDITVWGYYQLINNRKPVLSKKLLVQSLWLGAGIKLPTGKYNPSDKSSGSSDVNLFQLGTGSVDLNIGAMYDIRLQDIGLNLTANYKMNNSNRYHYSYGNKYNLNAQAYYKFNIKNKITLSPNAGLQFEQSKTDRDKGFTVDVSGGKLLTAAAGMEISYKKMAIGGNFQTPLSQDLAKGIVKANNRFMLHIAMAL